MKHKGQYSQWCVGERQEPFSLKPSSEYSCNLCEHLCKILNNDFIIIYPTSARLILSKNRILVKQCSGQMCLFMGYLNCHVPITWLIWGHSWSLISMNFSQIFTVLLIQCCTSKNWTWAFVLSNYISLFSWFKVCRKEKLYLRCFACSLVPALTARERATHWNLRELCCWS